MGEIVNLNRARKAKAKAAQETQAAENRVRFGLTKEEKRKRAAQDAAAKKHLDGHKLD
ncbi:DUF4169 domain-containing protein [Niveispirillum lacus]|uniref:DUF4169 domain-containing protein n=1 Tax=Niveispirillum lacus TaxID=1981099 RepID=A0A255YZ25_9PROT|nr:DUF4169 family protein [Niveispirillum lacus]OYQ33670.1 DUF4169 domain-containing protein [Niveispirillum lacus]